MLTLEELKTALEILDLERAKILSEGWYLQNCWLVQVRPGGTARTSRQYWQVRSRQAVFNGKMVKHVKDNELEDYKAAIDRGRQLKEIDRQIKKLQQQFNRLTTSLHASEPYSPANQTTAQAATQTPKLADRLTGSGQPADAAELAELMEQDLLVKEIIANSQSLRASLQKSLAHGRALMAANQRLRDTGLRVRQTERFEGK